MKAVDGKYQKIEPNEKGWLWSAVLELYLGVEEDALGYFTREGEKVASPQEDAFQERRRAEQERLRAERLAKKLRELGIDPDAI